MGKREKGESDDDNEWRRKNEGVVQLDGVGGKRRKEREAKPTPLHGRRS
jgi:hypothetical protein